MRIDFFKLDSQEPRPVLIGSMSLAGNQIVLDPPDSPFLQETLQERIYDFKTGQKVTAATPAEFLYALLNEYRSSYLFASIAQEEAHA